MGLGAFNRWTIAIIYFSQYSKSPKILILSEAEALTKLNSYQHWNAP